MVTENREKIQEPIILKKGDIISMSKMGKGKLQYSPVPGIPIRFTCGKRSKAVEFITGDQIIYDDATREDYVICSP